MKFSAKGVAMAKITVEASSSSSGSGGPSITGPPTGGSGSGRPPTGGSGSGRPPTGGSGSGSGGPPTGGIWDDMCFCVDEDVCNLPLPGGMGGGPQGSGRPPVGGSGSGRPPPGGSGSGRPPPGGSGSGRPPVGGSGSGGSGIGPVGGSGSGNNTGGTGGVTSGPGVTVPNVPNPGSEGGTFDITIVQSWSQETNYNRVTQVQVPPTTAGQKVPMVVDFHGRGGQGNLRRLQYLADGAVIVAPSGYERGWNVNNGKSKADDISFILELIARVAS